MKYKAVIFDLFGTLVGSLDMANYNSVLTRMAEAMRINAGDFILAWRAAIDDRMSGKHGHTTVEDVTAACRSMEADPEADRIAAACAIRVEFTAKTLVPAPDTLAVLAELRAAGYPIGLITDCTSEVPALWTATPLAPLIDHAIFSCREGMTKPDPRIYLLASERLGVSPHECLYVGDGSSWEITGAAKVGMRAVLLKGATAHLPGIERPDAASWRGEAIFAIRDILPIMSSPDYA